LNLSSVAFVTGPAALSISGPARDPGEHEFSAFSNQPCRPASMAATSIFFIVNITSKSRAPQNGGGDEDAD